jgi:hypothetical protein
MPENSGDVPLSRRECVDARLLLLESLGLVPLRNDGALFVGHVLRGSTLLLVSPLREELNDVQGELEALALDVVQHRRLRLLHAATARVGWVGGWMVKHTPVVVVIVVKVVRSWWSEIEHRRKQVENLR